MNPPEFAIWTFAQLGAHPGHLRRPVPGSGAIGRAWALYLNRIERGELDRAASVIDAAVDGHELHSPQLCLLLYGRGLVRLASGEDLQGALDDLLAYGAITAQVGYEERMLLWARSRHRLRPRSDITRRRSPSPRTDSRWLVRGAHPAASEPRFALPRSSASRALVRVAIASMAATR